MSYSKERDTFIQLATREGLDLNTITKLLRYSTTLQRLAEAQCNGDWPYNGDRDRPLYGDINNLTPNEVITQDRWNRRYMECPRCETPGVRKSSMRHSSEHKEVVCPDCRTQELVRALLTPNGDPLEVTCPRCGGDGVGMRDSASGMCSVCLGTKLVNAKVKPIFQGDPRGAVLVLSTPNYPWTDSGGRGLYVPARPTPIRG